MMVEDIIYNVFVLTENSKCLHSGFIWGMLSSNPCMEFDLTTLLCSRQLCDHKNHIMIYAKHFFTM